MGRSPGFLFLYAVPRSKTKQLPLPVWGTIDVAHGPPSSSPSIPPSSSFLHLFLCTYSPLPLFLSSHSLLVLFFPPSLSHKSFRPLIIFSHSASFFPSRSPPSVSFSVPPANGCICTVCIYVSKHTCVSIWQPLVGETFNWQKNVQYDEDRLLIIFV